MVDAIEKPKRGVVRAVHLGFVWIHGDDGIDRFMHRTAMQRTSDKQFNDLEKDDRVEFLHVDAERGPRAVEVRTI